MLNRYFFFLLLSSVFVFADVRVACVGNSITYGYDIYSWPDTTTYPHHLSVFLGEAVDSVGNFGVSGTTIRKDDNRSYWLSYQFNPAYSFSPNYVVVELGTNDASIYTQWITSAENNAYDSAIVADYESMIDTFQLLQSKPKMFICLAPYANNSSWNTYDTAITNHVNISILEAGLNKGVNVIDLHHYFDKSLLSEVDTVHPTVEGAKSIAEIVYNHFLKDTLKITQNATSLIAPLGYGYQWYKDNERLIGETSNTLLAPSVGKYKVSVKVDETALSRIVTEDFEVTEGSTKTNIQFITDRVYYQNEMLFVELASEKKLDVSIMDIQGRIVFTKKVEAKAGGYSLKMPSLSGNFIILIKSDNKVISNFIVKMKH